MGEESKMNRIFANALIERHIISESEMKEAVENGKELIVEDDEQKIIAYFWNDKIYIKEIINNANTS